MYPSAIGDISLARSASNPDFSSDQMAMDARNLTQKMLHVRKFWQQGIKTAASSFVNLPAATQSSSEPLITQPPKDENEEES